MPKPNDSRMIENVRTRAIYAFLFFLMALLAVVTVYPVAYIFLGSFKENRELVSGGLNILPKKFIVDNYVEAWETANFATYTWNSLFLGVMVTLVTLFTSSMAGYVFARREFRLKKLIYSTLVMFMFISVGSMSLRPLFELAVRVGLYNSLWGVILISAGGGQATFIFLVRGYMNTVPRELDEAARIDGCGFFQIYLRIILPTLRPVLGTAALLSFRGAWNEYILPLVFTMTNPKMRPLTVGVLALQNTGDGAGAWNLLFAGAAISIVPIILVYMAASRQFMSGMVSGAVKG